MTIHEPATFLTDCALAAWSGWLSLRLATHVTAPRPAVAVWWIRAFAVTGAAALVGGVSHGIGPELPAWLDGAIWRLALLGLAGTGLCLVQAAAHTAFSGRARRLAIVGGWVAVAGVAAWSMVRGDFLAAICAYGLGLLGVLGAAARPCRPLASGHLRWIAVATVLSGIAVAMQRSGYDPSPHFNHNDLYHVVQAAALGAYYRGARALGGSPATFD